MFVQEARTRNHPWSFSLPLGDITAAAVAKCCADYFQFSINIAATLSLLLSWQIVDVTRLCRGSLPLTPHLARQHSLVAESRSSLWNPRLFNNGLRATASEKSPGGGLSFVSSLCSSHWLQVLSVVKRFKHWLHILYISVFSVARGSSHTDIKPYLNSLVIKRTKDEWSLWSSEVSVCKLIFSIRLTQHHYHLWNAMQADFRGFCLHKS